MICDPAQWTRPPGRRRSSRPSSGRGRWPLASSAEGRRAGDPPVPRSRDLPRRPAVDPRAEPGPGAVLGRALRRRRGHAPRGLRDRAARSRGRCSARGHPRPCLPRRSSPWASSAAGSWGSRRTSRSCSSTTTGRSRATATGTPSAPTSTRPWRPCRACSAAGRAARSTSISGSGLTAAAGSPATSLSTFLDYYRAGGPAWGYERQALIKLRVIAGDPALGAGARGTPRPVRLRPRAVRPRGLAAAPPAPGRAARPARHDQRQVQPGRPRRRRVLRPGAADRPRVATTRRSGRRTPSGPRRPSASGRLPGRTTCVTLRAELPLLPVADRRPPRRPRPRQGPDRARRFDSDEFVAPVPPDAAPTPELRPSSGPSSRRGSRPTGRRSSPAAAELLARTPPRIHVAVLRRRRPPVALLHFPAIRHTITRMPAPAFVAVRRSFGSSRSPQLEGGTSWRRRRTT